MCSVSHSQNVVPVSASHDVTFVSLLKIKSEGRKNLAHGFKKFSVQHGEEGMTDQLISQKQKVWYRIFIASWTRK